MDGRGIPAEIKRLLENGEYYYFSQGRVLLYEVTCFGLISFLTNPYSANVENRVS